jgi:hypothetical protein
MNDTFLNILETNRLLFTFEINRHGARAPYWDDEIALKGFSVGLEMLTP